ncbi:MAG: P-type conjugative transfer protein TrbJ [Sphingosinicella sp.]|uniref:P-type conjugative transfer protein TrbJ n=1 Tax=Sphingosinicella sp. TaxID=1917971 RepID=UPI0040383CD4
MKKLMHIGLLGFAIAGSALGAGVVVTATPAHAIPVFDSANYAQNLLTAARTLQQINQQIQQLQNEARMLGNMDRNLARIDFPQLQQLRQRLGQINSLMGQARGVDFRVDQLDEQLRRLFPENLDRLLQRDQRVAGARARLDAAMSAFRQTMGVQSQIVANVREDAEALGEIVARSQGAEGALAVGQATNQLLALTAQQQFQIQQLMAAHFRGVALERAERAQIERESREQVRRFLGDGRAYTPRPRR